MRYEDFCRVQHWAQQFGPPVAVANTYRSLERAPEDVWCVILERFEGRAPYLRHVTTLIEDLEEFQDWILELHHYLTFPTTELPPYLKRHFAELFEQGSRRRAAA